MDFYFKLYGRKRPTVIPILELAMLRQPTNPVKQEKVKQEKFTIPKAEKRKVVPEEPEGKPVEFSGTVEAREVASRSIVGEVPDYFSMGSGSPAPSTSEVQPPPGKSELFQ